MLNQESKNDLTSCTNHGTIQTEIKKVDSTTKKLLDRLHEIQRQVRALRREEHAILTALEIAGVRPQENWIDAQESTYVDRQPFADKSLVEICKEVLADYDGQKLTKGQVEYLAARGGYKSSATDPKNSFEVTLRRLAADGYCQVKRVRGPEGNRYWVPKKEVPFAVRRMVKEEATS